MGSVKRDWETKYGNRALCIEMDDLRHLCGYVEVPKDHWLFERGYNTTLEGVSSDRLAKELIGKRGVMDLVTMSDRVRVGDLFDVHGSLTFSGVPCAVESGFWHGFDCGHYGDTREVCDEEYVMQECENLSEQLMVKWVKDLQCLLHTAATPGPVASSAPSDTPDETISP